MDVRSRKMDLDVERTDADLSRGAIAGDADAFEALYRRHAGAAWRVAQAVAETRDDAADAVSEGFMRMLQALADGKVGPDAAFLPYLLATTRYAAIDQYRYRTRVPGASDTAEPQAGLTPSARAGHAHDAGLVSQAFRGLPERWRSVLWLTEVEAIPVGEVGDRLGLSPNGTAQLARRARIGLRERYLEAHLQAPVAPECAAVAGALGAYADGTLTPGAIARIDDHLAGCDACSAAAAELADVGASLRAIALPLPAGLAALAFARYRSAFAVADQDARRLRMVGETDLTRPLAIAVTALLALGVIAAGLISNGDGPKPVAGARSGGAVGNPPTVLTQLAGSAGPARTATASPATALGLVIGLGGSGSAGTPSATAASSPTTAPNGPLVIPPTLPPGSQPAPGGSPGGTDALLQLELGVNLGVAPTTASVGVGGGCTGISISGSQSCTPAAPPSTGINLGLSSPLGPIIVDVPPASTTPSTPKHSAAPAPTPTGSAQADALGSPKSGATTSKPAGRTSVSATVAGMSLSL